MKRSSDSAANSPNSKRLNTHLPHHPLITQQVAFDSNVTMSLSTSTPPSPTAAAAASSSDSKQFFKPIGEHVVATTNGSQNNRNGDDGEGEEEEEEDESRMVQEIPSLCMECHEQGVTRMLLTYIPYFKEVIVVSFQCPHCGNRNNEIQSAGEIQEKGCLYTVHITTPQDLNRQVVKSEWCTVVIPDLEIEIPPKKGQLSTIEGILSDTLRDLEFDQPIRKHTSPEAYTKIEKLCDKLRLILAEDKTLENDNQSESLVGPLRSLGPVGGGSSSMTAQEKANRTIKPFSIRLDDPSGNSFIEFSGALGNGGISDPKWSKREYPRTKEQNELLGLAAPPPPTTTTQENQQESTDGGGFSKTQGETDFENEEIYTFQGTCSSCNASLETRMKKVNVPYFKDILIMSTNCSHCGYKDNEVKSGSAISENGRKLILQVQDSEDLSRDVLKSETAGLAIPEIDLQLAPGTLGGRFTTLEGLLQQVYDELSERVLMRGDSSNSSEVNRFESFLSKLKSVIACQNVPFTVILDDPLANSYIQNPYAPDPDQQVTVENYQRSFEQNEDLGLNDINVENYMDDQEQS